MGRQVAGGVRIDWRAVRAGIDLAAVATGLLGPAPGRRGERSSRKLWWHCPLHEDPNPSFCVEVGKCWWRCYGCGERGDAATLVMKIQGKTFREAVVELAGGAKPSGKARPQPQPKPRAKPQGMTPEDAAALVAEAVELLWSPVGANALGYLTGPRRGLTTGTIRAAALGVTPPLLDRPGMPRGIVVPWYNGQVLTLVKIRQPEGRQPKYYEVFRDCERHSGIYPGPEAIRAGQSLIISEGEFDRLLLRQELGDLVSIVTLGSASAAPATGILGAMLGAAPWYMATDADAAGDKAAAHWPASSRRVRPPDPFNDWTEARQGGVDLRRWWGDVLAGKKRPALFTWEELAGRRWGPAQGDPTSGIIID